MAAWRAVRGFFALWKVCAGGGRVGGRVVGNLHICARICARSHRPRASSINKCGEPEPTATTRHAHSERCGRVTARPQHRQQSETGFNLLAQRPCCAARGASWQLHTTRSCLPSSACRCAAARGSGSGRSRSRSGACAALPHGSVAHETQQGARITPPFALSQSPELRGSTCFAKSSFRRTWNEGK